MTDMPPTMPRQTAVRARANPGKGWMALRHAAGHILDFAAPPRCPTCRAPIANDGHFCASCWAQADLIGPPQCAQCGIPFSFAAAEGDICATCLAVPPTYDWARSAGAYTNTLRHAIIMLKHSGRMEAALPLARLMLRALPDLDGPLALVPIPLHPRRLLTRRYNQSLLLAQAVASVGRIQSKQDIVVWPDLLRRKRNTPPQKGLGRKARHRNVKGAFFADKPVLDRRRTVVLIDDVLTTGATANAAAAALRRAGMTRIGVLTAARTLK